MNIFDINKDGKVDFNDFVMLFTKLATSILKDGKISKEDILPIVVETIETMSTNTATK